MNRKWLSLFSLTILVMSLAICAWAGWQLYLGLTQATVITPPETNKITRPSLPVNARSAAEQASSITHLALFGSAQKKIVPKTHRPPPPPARINFELLGVLDAQGNDRGKDSTAIIAKAGGGAKIYHLGDSLPGNHRLAEIHPQHIVIEAHGRTQNLWLKGTDPTKQNDKTSTTPTNSQIRNTP